MDRAALFLEICGTFFLNKFGALGNFFDMKAKDITIEELAKQDSREFYEEKVEIDFSPEPLQDLLVIF